MQHAPHTGYAHLKAHLETWTPRPHSRETASQEHFLRLAEEYLLPELHKLASVLSDAGMDCTVVRDDMDTAGVGLRIDDLQATIGLSPGDCDASVRAVVSRDIRPNGQIEWFIPYVRIHKGLLERELQAAVMRLLTDRGRCQPSRIAGQLHNAVTDGQEAAREHGRLLAQPNRSTHIAIQVENDDDERE